VLASTWWWLRTRFCFGTLAFFTIDAVKTTYAVRTGRMPWETVPRNP
jgi:hypothetical protein